MIFNLHNYNSSFWFHLIFFWSSLEFSKIITNAYPQFWSKNPTKTGINLFFWRYFFRLNMSRYPNVIVTRILRQSTVYIVGSKQNDFEIFFFIFSKEIYTWWFLKVMGDAKSTVELGKIVKYSKKIGRKLRKFCKFFGT